MALSPMQLIRGLAQSIDTKTLAYQMDRIQQNAYNAIRDIVNQLNGTSTSGNGSSAAFTVANETQPSGTQGGTFTSGAWRTRTINTITPTQTWASISANQVTLTAGAYFISASAPCYRVDSNAIRFFNITDSTEDILGGVSSAVNGVQGSIIRAVLSGQITITGTKVFELQHQSQTTFASFGFGFAAGIGFNEVYSIVSIERLS